MQRGPWCNDRLKTSVLDNIRKINVREDILPRASAEGGGIKSTDSRSSGDSGATDFSRGMFSNDYRLPNEMDSVLHRRTQERYPPKITGFPISIRRGNWCTGLKTSVF